MRTKNLKLERLYVWGKQPYFLHVLHFSKLKNFGVHLKNLDLHLRQNQSQCWRADRR